MSISKKKAKKQQELRDLRKVLAFLLHQPQLRLEAVYNEKARQIRPSFREHDLHETKFAGLCPAMLLEWIRSPSNLTEYLSDKTNQFDFLDVVEIIAQSFEGLQALHEHDLVHWDMKSDNVLVDEGRVAKITDLGNARHRKRRNSSIAQSTFVNLPPVIRKLVPPMQPGDGRVSERTEVPVGPKSEFDHPWLDLWMLAFELDRLFLAVKDWSGDSAREPADPFDPALAERFLSLRFPENDEDAQFALESIRIVIRRLVLPRGPTDSAFYREASEVVADLRKIAPEFGAAQKVLELRAVPQHVIRLPWTYNAVFTKRVEALFNSALIRRVSRHRQLSTLKHVYPGAEHKRSEHIAGVLNSVVTYVRALYADRTNPFWRLTMEQEDVETLLLAALVHDIGHIAFGHYAEEVAVFFRGRMHEDYAIALLDSHRAGPFGARAKTAIERDRGILRNVIRRYWKWGDKTETLLRYVAEIIEPQNQTEAVCDSGALLRRESTQILKIQVLHSIIDSAIDADKLDYLIRDGLHCGVRYSRGIDVDRFLQSLTVLSQLACSKPDADDEPDVDYYRSERRQACIAVTEKGVLPVESMLFARYQMFSSVYWNKTVRAETAILQFLIQRYIALQATETKARDQLDLLTNVFREEDDTSALRWLSGEFKSPRNGMSKAQRQVLIDMCDALLGDRGKLYWSAFELQYRAPGTPEGTVLKRSHARKLHERVVRDWERYAADGEEASSETGDVSLLRVINHRASIRKQFGEGLAEKLKLSTLPYQDGELLVDVPPRNKDQIRNVYVVGGNDLARIIQQSSPIADAVSDAFRYWTRRIRIFLSPRLWNKLSRRGIDSTMVHQACHAVMNEIVTAPSEDDLFRWVQKTVERKNRTGRRGRGAGTSKRGQVGSGRSFGKKIEPKR